MNHPASSQQLGNGLAAQRTGHKDSSISQAAVLNQELFIDTFRFTLSTMLVHAARSRPGTTVSVPDCCCDGPRTLVAESYGGWHYHLSYL